MPAESEIKPYAMSVSTALSEVASECETRAISFDYPKDQQRFWAHMGKICRDVEARIGDLPDPAHLTFSPAVGFPVSTPEGRVTP